ncbi:unnamed protein product [Nippostrongylus brasiliensis]|uniref:Serine/threonine-protein phosphatase n=1 Tax=Nippostrongylus brasiliensis TaxID=27835 RepID=A0A0N4YD79_NIPBR|nr:unnamed protein product [Nippostrongylus brasiliensis]
MKAASGPFSRENTLQLAPFQRKKKKVPFKLPNSRLGELVNGFKTYKKPQKMSATLCTMLENTIRGIFTTTAATVNNGNLLNYDDMREICLRSRELLLNEPCFVLATPPLVIIGDVHGQLFDTLDILNYIGVPPSRRLLFLGDYVDRGEHSLEIITMLLAFKLRFPKEIFLLRGNHETRCVNRQYGFYDECKKKFPKKGVELWTLFQHVFNCLPVAALVGSKIFCAHGGISEDLINFKQFERCVAPILF